MTNWPQFLPSGLPQYLKEDTDACTSYATVDSIETQILAMTGQRVQFSRRRLAQKSKTSPTQGNSEQNVFPVAAQGLVLESSWPQRSDMTDAEFYATPTPEEEATLMAEEAEFCKHWNVTFNFFVPFTKISVAPLIARVNVTFTFHFIEVLSKDLYYDSEYNNGHIGVIPASTYPVVVEYHQIVIKRKDSMILVNNNGTYYVEGDKGYLGINHVEFLQELLKITDQIEARPPVGVQLGIVEASPAGFIIKQN
jgi:hypothetical protein